MIWSLVRGPRRYDIAHLDVNTTGASSLTLCMRKTRFPSPAMIWSISRAVVRLPRAGRSALKGVEDAQLVPLRLEPPDEPGAGVGQALVVQVHRVLRDQGDARRRTPAPASCSVSSGSLEGGFATGGQVAEDLVDVEDGPQAGASRSACASSPTTWFSSSETKNMRSASLRWAMEKMETRGLPPGP